MKNFSASEENYLKCIFSLSAKYAANNNNNKSSDAKQQVALVYNTVSTSALAEKMRLRSASVTNMLKKLHKNGLIEYTPYQGVRLSADGQKIALHTIRKHRLWETFLYEKLHFNWQEVHEIAEQLEHIKSSTLINRLDTLLGCPHFDPHGDPIPDINGNIYSQKNTTTLSKLNVGEHGTIKRILENSDELLIYLNEIGLVINTPVKMLSINTFDLSYKILLGVTSKPATKNPTNHKAWPNNTSEQNEFGEQSIFISHKIAQLILLER